MIFGDGRQSRDFVFVGDVVRALLAAMQRACRTGPVFNICTGHATTIWDLAMVIAEILGRQPCVSFAPPRMGEIRASIGCPTAALEALGFCALTSLKSGLARTLKG